MGRHCWLGLADFDLFGSNNVWTGTNTFNNTLSGTGFTSLFASPPAVGGTAAAAGKFTTLQATSNLTTNVTGLTQCLHVNTSGVVSGSGLDCGSAAVGFTTAYYDDASAKWVYVEPNGTIVTPTQTTCALQEALNYAYNNNLSLEYYGRGASIQCAVSGLSITVPPQYGNSFYGYGMNFSFTNTTQPGLIFDTQRYGKFRCAGCIWNYVGTSSAIIIQPSHGPGAISCTGNDTACWAVLSVYELGTVFVNGGATAAAALYIDITQGNGANQLRSSEFTTNKIHLDGIACQSNSQYGILINTPANAYQAMAENQIEFGDINGCTTASVGIGTGAGDSKDVNLGTNFYTGNIDITGNTANTVGIISDTSSDVFNLTSINCYQSVGSQVNINWTVDASMNKVNTSQVIACGGGVVTDSSTAKTNRIVISPSTLSLPVAIAGLPTCGATTSGWLYNITNGVASPAYRDAVSTTGSTPNLVYCNASGWSYH